MGPCTAQTSACPTAATPWEPALMPTWRPTPCCPPSTLCDCGAGAHGRAAAPACPAGPTPTSRSPTLSTRTPKPVSGPLGLCRALGYRTGFQLQHGLCAPWRGALAKLVKIALLSVVKRENFLHSPMKYPPTGDMTDIRSLFFLSGLGRCPNLMREQRSQGVLEPTPRQPVC